MRVNIVIGLLISTFSLYGQSDLKFDRRFVQSEDKWVAFKPDSLNSYSFGFIYIDSQAGLTLDYAGKFKIDSNGKYIAEKWERNSSMKYRLEPNNVLVAHIPDNRLSELEIDKIPEWLKFYKTGEGTVEQLYRWGYMYNGWNECEKALEFLLRADKIDPKFKGLQVELAFSYNCLKQFDKAISHLKYALKDSPNDSYSNKELIFAQTKIGQIQDAEKVYNHVLSKCDDQSYNAENAYNIIQAYYKNKDVQNFDRWYLIVGSTLTSDERFKPLVDKMKSDLKP